MKTKLYLFFTGLLMAACITSYGQEIVSEFNYNFGGLFSYNDLETCSDGSVLSGIYCFDPYSYQPTGFHVCKFSPEGLLLDSVTIASAWDLFGIPDMPDTFILPDYHQNDVDSIFGVTMTFIDANLNIINTVSTRLNIGYDPQLFEIDAMCIAPSSDLIVSYWIGETFCIARIGLDGTLIASNETSGILPYSLNYTHPVDSALNYQSFGIFDESPEYFYKLGGYIAESYDEPWPLIAYIFDADLNLTDTIVYGYLSDDTNCDFATREHIVPLEKNTFKETYLMATQIHYDDGTNKSSLVKFDVDNNLLAIAKIESDETEYGNPSNTIVVDENTIYHTYESYADPYSPAINLVRLDGDLNVIWNIELPTVLYGMSYGSTLKVLPNGDIAVSTASYRSMYCRLYIFIVRDNDPTDTPELTTEDKNVETYPIPVKNTLNISYKENVMPTSVELYDLTGRLVATKHSSLESIDMSAMPAGVYMLRVTMKDGTSYHEKIIKE